MTAYEILHTAEAKLLNTGNPLSVQTTLDDVTVLGDVNALRCLKLEHSFPKGFKRSTDIFACAKKVVEGDSIYRVLEFFVMKNKILEQSVYTVFPQMAGAGYAGLR